MQWEVRRLSPPIYPIGEIQFLMTDSLHDAASGRRALRGAGQLRETLLQQAQGAAGVRLPVKGQALIKFAAVLDPHDEDLELSAAAAFGGRWSFSGPRHGSASTAADTGRPPGRRGDTALLYRCARYRFLRRSDNLPWGPAGVLHKSLCMPCFHPPV